MRRNDGLEIVVAALLLEMLFASRALRGVAGFMPYTPVATNPIVFFDVTCGEMALPRVTIELFADVVPKAAENFRSLCTGERGVGPAVKGNCAYFFKGIPFHRIVPGYVVQGGDIAHRDGRGNDSIFGYPFPSESLSGKAGRHLSGTIAMAYSSPNENGSQFFFNLAEESKHLNGKYMVVGQVLQGWDTVLFVGQRGSRSGIPTTPTWISECGQSGGVEMEDLACLDTSRSAKLPGKEVLDILRPR